MAEAKKTAQEFSTYKGRPLVRCGDEIYYGNMSEPYVIRLQVKSKNEVKGLQVADKVTVQLLATDPDLSPRKKLVKSSEKHGLFFAKDIADIWLERALANNLILMLKKLSHRFVIAFLLFVRNLYQKLE